MNAPKKIGPLIEDNDLRIEARKQYGNDQDVEIDHDGTVSHGDGGAWVAAWVWVDYEEESDS